MGSTTTVRYDFTPEMDRPILIEGLPGVGEKGGGKGQGLLSRLAGEEEGAEPPQLQVLPGLGDIQCAPAFSPGPKQFVSVHTFPMPCAADFSPL